MNSYKDDMKWILEAMASGDYEGARARVLSIKEDAVAKHCDLEELEPEWGIAVASLAMDEGDFAEAEKVLAISMKADINNYEIYYMIGLCKEQTGQVEAAYYAYRMAGYLGRGTADEQLIMQQFSMLCSYADANPYELGKACEEIVTCRVRLGEYERTHAFLAEQLYDNNRTAAGIVLSEQNMLLLMMLEIVLCEKKRMSEEAFITDNTILRYAGDVDAFNQVYRQVKLMMRRVWFGAGLEQQKELNDLLDREKVSADMLAVIAKYSIREEYWEDAFARIAAIIQYKHPQLGMAMLQYKNWLGGLEIDKKSKCFQPNDYDNKAEVYRLDCQSESVIRTTADRESTIAAVFCTNDKLYEAECIKYLKRLAIPDGMRLIIVPVWNGKGMAASYNTAMRCVDAKYKMYIHHDTFIIKKNLLDMVVNKFKEDDRVGLIGIAGTRKLNSVAKWWQSAPEDLRMSLYQDAVLNILSSASVYKQGDMEDAEALDGIFIATSKDVPWREDVFDGWHFYDISQGYEHRKAGNRTCVMNCDDMVIMHETTMKKDPKNLYDVYRELFVKEYLP